MVVDNGLKGFVIVVLPVVYQRDLKWDGKKVLESMEKMVGRSENVLEVGQNKESSSDMDLATDNIIELGKMEMKRLVKGELVGVEVVRIVLVRVRRTS